MDEKRMKPYYNNPCAIRNTNSAYELSRILRRLQVCIDEYLNCSMSLDDLRDCFKKETADTRRILKKMEMINGKKENN